MAAPAAFFMISTAPWFARTWCPSCAYNSLCNQQGLLKSGGALLPPRWPASRVSRPLTDFYSRRLFNDVFFRRYKGESEDRLRYLPKSCSRT
jgi:hypothetical protein